MKLEVPYHKNPSDYCGEACAKMVLEYFGVRKVRFFSLKELAKSTLKTEEGTWGLGVAKF
jgi:hypothetical protein